MKKGAKVILTLNLNSSVGYLAHGLIGYVTHLDHDLIMVRFDRLNRDIAIGRELFEHPLSDDFGTKRVRSQFPLILAFGLSIHMSQGSEYDRVFLHCPNLFAFSHFYTAASRATRDDALILVDYFPGYISEASQSNGYCVSPIAFKFLSGGSLPGIP
jgi:ATP-dependent exoDNAse (exonuclease V) alpha subunit